MTSPNDLTDLREALEDRAVGLDTVSADRVGQIHARVRGVRRRRRAVGAVGVAAVLATVAGVSLAPGDGPGPEPATTIVGVQAPATLTSLGYTYELLDGVDGEDGRARIRLAPSDEPRLVSWATSGDDDSVRLSDAPGAGAVTYTDADFTNWILVPAGEDPTTVRVAVADGEPGLAVYSLGASRPAGYTAYGVTFRQSTDEGELLGAVVGAPGQDEVRLPAITAPGGTTTEREFCSGAPEGAWLHVESSQGMVSSGECLSDARPVDGDSTDASSGPTPAGTDLGLRAYVTDGRRGPRLEDPDIVIGLAVYDGSGIETVEGGFPSNEESGGHRYRLAEVGSMEPGQSEFQTTAPVGDSAVLTSVRVAGRNLSSVAVFDGQRSGSISSPGASSSVNDVVVSPGAPVRVELGLPRDIGGSGPEVLEPGESARVGFYVRAD